MLFAILSMGIISYSVSYSALTNQISNERVNTLIQTRNTADVTLKEIEKVFISQSISSQLLKFTEAPLGNNYETLTQTIKNLVSIKNSNKYIYSAYIYLPKEKLVVTTEDGYWKEDDFYDSFFKDGIKRDKMGRWISTRYIKGFTGERNSVITYVTPISFNENMDSSYNLLVVNVYEKELYKLIQDKDSSMQGQSIIVDEEGNLVADKDEDFLSNEIKYDKNIINKVLLEESSSFRYKTSEGTYLVSHVRSEYTKWNYISIIPEKQIIKPIVNLKVIIIVVATICTILGLFAARIVSSRIYRPISNTLKSVKKQVKEMGTSIFENNTSNEMDFINETIQQIAAQNKDLRNDIIKSETVLKEGFISDLLLGSVIDEIEFEDQSNRFKMTFGCSNFYVFTILVDNYNSFCSNFCEKDRYNYYYGIKNISEEIINLNSYGIIVQTDKDKFAAVLNCSQKEKNVTDIAENIKETVKHIFKFTVTIGISPNFLTLKETGYMYNEALKNARARMMLGGDRVIGSMDIKAKNSDAYLLSTSKEEQILNNIKQGNIEEVIRSIEKATNAISKISGYPQEQIHEFFYSILHTAIKAVSDNGWSVSAIFGDDCNLYRDLEKNDTLQEIKTWIYEVLPKMENFIKEKKESKAYHLVESVLKYIQNNYNKDISLNSMAEHVSLSTPYLSKLFKKETGENFLEYLTKTRIEKSKELLTNPKYKITSIAVEVNFGNAQNFIRIFKRYEGMTPGQYRELNIKSNIDNL